MYCLNSKLKFLDELEIREEKQAFQDKCGHCLDLWAKYERFEEQSEYDDLISKMRPWIRANLKGRVYHDGDLLFRFEYPEDLIAFQLVFG